MDWYADFFFFLNVTFLNQRGVKKTKKSKSESEQMVREKKKKGYIFFRGSFVLYTSVILHWVGIIRPLTPECQRRPYAHSFYIFLSVLSLFFVPHPFSQTRCSLQRLLSCSLSFRYLKREAGTITFATQGLAIYSFRFPN